MDGDKPGSTPNWGLAATAGSSLVGAVVAGIVLDIELKWMPWATLVGLALGSVSCMSLLIRAAKANQSDSSNDKPKNGSPP